MTAALLRPTPRPALPRLDEVRIAGALEEDARIAFSVGREPRAWLQLVVLPPRGLRYHVAQDLGTDPTDHMLAEARLPQLRRGALVTATGRWLRVQRDHGHEVLVLMECTGVHVHSSIQAVLAALESPENPACS